MGGSRPAVHLAHGPFGFRATRHKGEPPGLPGHACQGIPPKVAPERRGWAWGRLFFFVQGSSSKAYPKRPSEDQ